MARRRRAGFPVVVHTMLVRDKELFLLRRAHTGFMDGYYALPGGHQHQGESVSAAARREVREETGIDLTAVEPRCVLPYRDGVHQGLNFVFEATAFVDEPTICEPQLFDACCWAPIDDLPQPVAPWLQAVIEMPREVWYREFHWD